MGDHAELRSRVRYARARVWWRYAADPAITKAEAERLGRRFVEPTYQMVAAEFGDKSSG